MEGIWQHKWKQSNGHLEMFWKKFTWTTRSHYNPNTEIRDNYHKYFGGKDLIPANGDDEEEWGTHQMRPKIALQMCTKNARFTESTTIRHKKPAKWTIRRKSDIEYRNKIRFKQKIEFMIHIYKEIQTLKPSSRDNRHKSKIEYHHHCLLYTSPSPRD